MANEHRGQVALGDYTLSFSVNALCDLEDALGKSVARIATDLADESNVKMSTVRTLVWAALRDHHGDVDLTEAGKIATAAGMVPAMAAVGEAFALAFPKPSGKEGKENPLKGTAA